MFVYLLDWIISKRTHRWDKPWPNIAKPPVPVFSYWFGLACVLCIWTNNCHIAAGSLIFFFLLIQDEETVAMATGIHRHRKWVVGLVSFYLGFQYAVPKTCPTIWRSSFHLELIAINTHTHKERIGIRIKNREIKAPFFLNYFLGVQCAKTAVAFKCIKNIGSDAIFFLFQTEMCNKLKYWFVRVRAYVCALLILLDSSV